MFVYDSETLGFLAVNAAAVQHYGYTEDEFLTMTIKDIRRPEDIPYLLNIIHPAFGVYKGTWKHRTRAGKLIDVEIISHRLEFGGRGAGSRWPTM